MRLVLYNIRYAIGAGPLHHMPVPFAGSLFPSERRFRRIQTFLDTLHPDIVVLVEADRGSYRCGGQGQAESLATSLERNWESAFAPKYSPRSVLMRTPVLRCQGNALVSRLPIRSVRMHDLRRGMKRHALEVALDGVTLLAVHLPLGRQARGVQFRELADVVADIRGPLIVAGDLNTRNDKSDLKEFLRETGLRSANLLDLPTYPADWPRRQLDYVLHSPELHSLRFHRPYVPYSDHLPLAWDFALPGERFRQGGSETT